MLRSLFGNVLIPLFEGTVKGRDTFRYWGELEQSQWLGRAELEARQFQALKNLLAHAAAHSPYYRDAWRQAGLDPDKVHTPTDFEAWPVIDRAVIRQHRADLRAAAPGQKLISKSTGGSSGVPLQFDLDWGSHDRRAAMALRGYAWAGARPGTRQTYLWGGTIGNPPALRRWKDRLYAGLYRRRMLNSFDLSEDRVPWFFDQLRRSRPDVVVAYTNALYHLAGLFEDRGLRPPPPKSIIVGAEKLHPFQRERIERVFGAPVFETYGSREFMLTAAECDRHEGLHLATEYLLVEILDDAGRPAAPGVEGNVVVTDLFNYGMPFVRYANGDRAVAGWGTCSCGRGLPLLRKVVGRQLDVLRTPDGRRVPGEFFPHLLKDFAGVKRFQVVQEKPDQVRLRVIPGPAWTDADARRIAAEAGRALGPAVHFEIVPVDDIPLTAAGKFQVVVNRCPDGAAPGLNPGLKVNC